MRYTLQKYFVYLERRLAAFADEIAMEKIDTFPTMIETS